MNPAAVAPPHAIAAADEVKLLDVENGWASTRDALFWTSDGGAKWRPITPPAVMRGSQIASVSFLNITTGWVLISGSTDTGEPKLSLSSTTDNGTTWANLPVTLPNIDPANFAGASGPNAMSFGDALHGWMVVDMVGSSNFRPGALYMTSDGGRTWQPSRCGGGGGAVVGIGPSDAWFVGGPTNGDLVHIMDGGRNCAHMILTAPAGIYSATDPAQVDAAKNAAYGLPIFSDPQHGFVTATYSGAAGVKSAAALFTTVDDGKTWKPGPAITDLPESAGPTLIYSVADSTWIIVTRHHKDPFVLTRLSSHAKVTAGSIAGCAEGCLFPKLLSFVTPDRGWVLDGDLFLTADGGATWKVMTLRGLYKVYGSDAKRINDGPHFAGLKN